MTEKVDFQEINFDSFPEINEFENMIQSVESIPYFKVNQGLPLNHMKIDGKNFINFQVITI
jgi:hypothetical protein